MRATISERDYETLSAYMDGQLSSGERRKLEERLHARPELRTALEEMQRMRTLLRQAPRRRAPRNFTLTPAMVGEQRKPRTSPWMGLFPVLSFTSAVAALLLIVVLTLQLSPGSQAPQTVAMQAPQAATEMQSAEQPAEPPAAEAGAPAAKMMNTPTEGVAALAAPQAQTTATPAPSIMAAAPATEEPAEEAPGIAEAQPTGTPAADQSLMAAGEMESTLPPVINWGGLPAVPADSGVYGGLGGGMGGDGTGGLGGGPMMGAPVGMGGGGGGDGFPPGGVYLPPESVESQIESAQLAPDTEVTATPEAAQEDNARSSEPLSGTGPILGVPSEQEGGQIIDRQAISGATLEPTAAALAALQPEAEQPAAEEQPAAQPEAEQPAVEEQPAAGHPSIEEPEIAEQPSDANQAEAQPERTLSQRLQNLDRQTLLVVEILLGLITLAAGGAAYYLWRKRSRR